MPKVTITETGALHTDWEDGQHVELEPERADGLIAAGYAVAGEQVRRKRGAKPERAVAIGGGDADEDD